MARDRAAALAAALVLALVVVLEFLPALSLGFAGDDFELISLARIGGFAPDALVLPHRGAFVKPVLNALWAACAALFGANAGAWYTLALLVHLLNATPSGPARARAHRALGEAREARAPEGLRDRRSGAGASAGRLFPRRRVSDRGHHGPRDRPRLGRARPPLRAALLGRVAESLVDVRPSTSRRSSQPRARRRTPAAARALLVGFAS